MKNNAITNKTIAKRERSIRKYFDTLQENYSKLNVLRLDLGYKKPYSDNVTLDDLNEDISRMLNNRRHNSIYDNMVGYICKKEHTPDKGLHTHIVVLFDGQKVINDVTRSKQIGEYWSKNITGNKGSFHSCNIDADEVYGEDNAVGMLKHDDGKKRENLDKVVSYLCKESQNIAHLKGNPKEKALIRGTMPRKKSTRGRPRKDDK